MSKLSRRSLVASAAALPALTVPALAASEPDPIFAAIENHRLSEDETKIAWSAADVPDIEDDDPLMISSKKAYAAMSEAAAELLDTKPTTIAGAIALLTYMVDHDPAGRNFHELLYGFDERYALNDDGETSRTPDWFVMRNVLALLDETKA